MTTLWQHITPRDKDATAMFQWCFSLSLRLSGTPATAQSWLADWDCRELRRSKIARWRPPQHSAAPHNTLQGPHHSAELSPPQHSTGLTTVWQSDKRLSDNHVTNYDTIRRIKLTGSTPHNTQQSSAPKSTLLSVQSSSDNQTIKKSCYNIWHHMTKQKNTPHYLIQLCCTALAIIAASKLALTIRQSYHAKHMISC